MLKLLNLFIFVFIVTLFIPSLTILFKDKINSIFNYTNTIYFILLITSFFYLIRNHKLRFINIHILFISLIFVIYISFVMNEDFMNYSSSFFGITRGIIICYIFFLLRDNIDVNIVLKAFFILSLLAALFGIYQEYLFVIGEDVKFGLSYEMYIKSDINDIDNLTLIFGIPIFRISPFIGDPNYYSLYLLPGLIVIYYNSIKLNIFTRISSTFIIVIALFLTLSRGAILIVVILIIYDFIFNKKNILNFRNIIFTMFCISVVILITINLIKLRSDSSKESNSERLGLIKTSVLIIAEKPILGYGVGRHILTSDTTGKPMVAHNSYIELILSTGIIGLGIFILIVVQAFKINKVKEFKMFLIAMLVSGFFLSNLILVLYWLGIALMFIKKDE